MNENIREPARLSPRSGWLTRLVTDLLFLVKSERKWWLLPFFVILLLMTGLLVFVVMTGPLAPFIYPIL